MTLQLNPTVGVAPGTTTMTLGDCPPDEPWQYVTPPVVVQGPPPGVSPDITQMPKAQFWDPYTDPPHLRGLGSFTSDLSTVNWGFVVFTGVAAFAIAFGVFYWKDRKRKAAA